MTRRFVLSCLVYSRKSFDLMASTQQAIEKVSWTTRVKNEVKHSVNEERSIIHTTKPRKANWIGHILRRNCLMKNKKSFQKKTEHLL